MLDKTKMIFCKGGDAVMEQAFLELIKSRRSIRSYRPDAIPKELLDAVLEAGTYAPSAMGRQSATIREFDSYKIEKHRKAA